MDILIIEQEEEFANHLENLLVQSDVDWSVHIAANLEEARKFILELQQDPLVILSEFYLPDGNSLDVFEHNSLLGVIWVFLSTDPDMSDVVRAMRLGAYSVLEKPPNQEKLYWLLNNAAKNAVLQNTICTYDDDEERYTVEAFLGESSITHETRSTLQALSQAPFSALIINGETGTGKGLAAKIIHYNSDFNKGAFIAVNCAAIPKDLIESQLFGHEAGAFTGAKTRHKGFIEQAKDGSLFLDEIAELGLDLQAKLLKAIEEKEIRRLGGESLIPVNFRVIAATHQDLGKAVAEGHFREDLLHRLNVFRLTLPTLRERVEDIHQLLPIFIDYFNSVSGKKVSEVPGKVWEKLLKHQWPGNVRELRNVVERCVLLSQNHIFPEKWLQLEETEVVIPEDELTVCFRLDGHCSLEEIEKQVIIKALALESGNVTAAARRISITRQTLRYRIDKLNIENEADGC